jgi:hypothetical protein
MVVKGVSVKVLEARDDLPAVEGTDPGNSEMQLIRG